MNGLENLLQVLERGDQEVLVDPELGREAVKPLKRMLTFTSGMDLAAAHD